MVELHFKLATVAFKRKHAESYIYEVLELQGVTWSGWRHDNTFIIICPNEAVYYIRTILAPVCDEVE